MFFIVFSQCNEQPDTKNGKEFFVPEKEPPKEQIDLDKYVDLSCASIGAAFYTTITPNNCEQDTDCEILPSIGDCKCLQVIGNLSGAFNKSYNIKHKEQVSKLWNTFFSDRCKDEKRCLIGLSNGSERYEAFCQPVKHAGVGICTAKLKNPFQGDACY